jgi:hypothetical protein
MGVIRDYRRRKKGDGFACGDTCLNIYVLQGLRLVTACTCPPNTEESQCILKKR